MSPRLSRGLPRMGIYICDRRVELVEQDCPFQWQQAHPKYPLNLRIIKLGSNCARTIDVINVIERRPTTEIRVAYDNSTWHAMNTTYINSTKETSSRRLSYVSAAITIGKCWQTSSVKVTLQLGFYPMKLAQSSWQLAPSICIGRQCRFCHLESCRVHLT